MITVWQPNLILFGGPMASRIVSPWRHAGRLLISTVWLPSMTTPGPCGGTGRGVVQTCLSAGVALMRALIAASAVVLTSSAAAFAAGPPGVPAAAVAAASATLIAVSATFLGPCKSCATAANTLRHAGRNPIFTSGLAGPGCNKSGRG